MIRNYRIIKLPREQLVRNLMSRSFANTNLPLIFKVLKPEQRLVNILFDEVKLLKTEYIQFVTLQSVTLQFVTYNS